MIDVAALGELLIDFTCAQVDDEGYPTMQAHPGGAPANFLAALSRFGCKTAMLGKVGKDAFGSMLTATLHARGIDTRGLVQDESVFTTLAFVTLDATGNRSFSFARKPGADTCIRFEELDLSIIDDCRVFHFGTLSLTNEPARTATYQAVEYARTHGKLITFDPNLRKPLWANLEEAKEQMLWGLSHGDVVKISDEEVEFLFGLNPADGAQYILDHFDVRLVFVTCGPQSCYFQNRKCSGWIPSLSGIQVVDTTGAGDIFGGSAVYGILQENTPPEDLTQDKLSAIVRFACAAAGLSTTKAGGISSVPSFSDVIAAMKTI